MTLREAEPGKTYMIDNVETSDEDVSSFLFRLGCYSGEPITVISHKRGGCIVAIKDGRYNLDNNIAESILI